MTLFLRKLTVHIIFVRIEGTIQPSVSPWTAPVVLVKKKDGTKRFCVDYRKLNSVTRRDSHPIPHVQDTLDCLHGTSYFPCLDLRSGYWQVEVDKDVRSFLGLANYYRRFIKNFAAIASPLNKLTGKYQFSCNSDCDIAFSTLKSALISVPILAYPDFSIPFELHTDPSSTGISLILLSLRLRVAVIVL